MAGLKKVRLVAGAAALCTVGIAGMAGAQVQPTPIPGLENYSLPEATPRVQPVPTATPTAGPTSEPSPAVPLVVPTPTSPGRAAAARPTPTPTATPSPAATRTPAAQPAPTAAPRAGATPIPVPTATVAPAASSPGAGGVPQGPEQEEAGAAFPDTAAEIAPGAADTAAVANSADSGGVGWLWPVVIGLIVLAGAGLLLWRRRPERLQALPAPMPDAGQPSPAEAPVAPPRPASPAQPQAQVRAPVQAPPEPQPPVLPAGAPQFLDLSNKMPPARIELDDPMVSRAGVNMVTATADVTVVVRNASDVPARGVMLDVRLTSAQPAQDAAIAALFTGPVPRPAVPAFDLAPGETKRVRALVTMPRDAITVLQAGGRPMFVPVVAIRAVHGGGQTTAVHALGIERPGQAKLGPIWLDQPSRMFDTVGVRPHSGQW
ncbi:hypothetical protein [Sphingomonas mucosissima]|nr:hypothetical protein [Sphingomonas mucosissima]